MDDLSDVIALLSSGTYAVTRRGPAAFTAGRAVQAAPTTLTITASVQPIRGRELDRLEELYRTRELQALWTATELRTAGAAGEADTVEIGGASWQVQSVESWAELGGYWKVLVARMAR
jgi:hypothetical protein